MNINYKFTTLYPQKPRFDNLKCKLKVSERRDRYRSVNIPEKQIDVFIQEFDDNKKYADDKFISIENTLNSILYKLSNIDIKIDNFEKKFDKQESNFNTRLSKLDIQMDKQDINIKNIENLANRSNVFLGVLVSLILFSANNDTVVGKITGALLSKIPGI